MVAMPFLSKKNMNTELFTLCFKIEITLFNVVVIRKIYRPSLNNAVILKGTLKETDKGK